MSLQWKQTPGYREHVARDTSGRLVGYLRYDSSADSPEFRGWYWIVPFVPGEWQEAPVLLGTRVREAKGKAERRVS